MTWKETFIETASYHANLLASGNIPLWILFADLHPVTTSAGAASRLTWWNWFLKVNMLRIYNGLEPTMYPPPN